MVEHQKVLNWPNCGKGRGGGLNRRLPIFPTDFRKRPQLLVATPGRLNDLLEPPAGPCGEAPVKVKKFEENIVG